MTHSNLLSRRLEIGTGLSLSSGQLAIDSSINHFVDEASNPITLASMTFGSLAFQGTRAGLLGLGLTRNPFVRNVLSYTGALAGEVTIFRASNTLLANAFKSTHTFQGDSGKIFGREWFSTALDFSLLKFAGAATGTQNIFLRHASQDFAMVSGHELGAQLGWVPGESGTFIEKLFRAEAMNWQMIAGSALGHRLTGGRLQTLERSLSLRSEVLSHHFTRIEPRWDNRLPVMAASADIVSIPEDVRTQITRRAEEKPKQWAQRLLDYTSTNPEAHALHVTRQLYEYARNPETRDFTLQALRQMVSLTIPITEGKNILVREYAVRGIHEPLLIVSLPTTFLPEAWSHTFVHGMALDHQSHSQQRELAIEVGSGTGYVSIAMSKLGMAKRIIATDKNQQAPLIGMLNAAINGVENIEFQTGDLLADIPEGIRADLIVGCLPQMPSAKPKKEISLRDLADYAEERGVFEDQLGLGLNATVIDQARSRLSPKGKLRLMMAQRPGLTIVHDLFATRGYAARIIHSTFIQQDPTTDFAALAKIEKGRGFLFDFRTQGGAQIPAQIAIGLKRDEIFHYLHLVEATPYEYLMQRSIDEMGPEFPRWAYTEDPGSESPILRSQVHQWLEKSWGIEIDPETVFIAPSHAIVLDGILRLAVAPLRKVGIVGNLDPASQRVVDAYPEIRKEIFDENLHSLAERVKAQPPQVLILKFSRQILKSRENLEELFSVAIRHNILLVFLEEQGALINSSDGRVLLKALSTFPQALTQSVVIHPVDRIFHAASLPLAAAIIPHAKLYEQMMHYGDVTYSRTSSAVQAIYSALFEQADLQAAIGATRRYGTVKSMRWDRYPQTILARQLSASNTFYSSPLTSHPDPIVMDFGESEWKPPLAWGDVLQRASQILPEELYRRAHLATLRYLESSRSLSLTDHEITLGAGVQPLVVAAIRGIRSLAPANDIEVLVPVPSYGIFFPTIEAAGAKLVKVPTSSAEGFLLTPRALRAFPRTPGTTRVLLINTPTNPAGQYYKPRDLYNLAQATTAQGDYLFVDEVFGLTKLFEHIYPQSAGSMEAFQGSAGRRLVTFGGISKEFALGGLRFGFAASLNTDLITTMKQNPLYAADPISLAAGETVLNQWRSLLAPHIQYLENRAGRLERFFSAKGIHVHRVEGGYSLFADLGELFSNPHFIHGERLTAENFHHLLLKHAGIRIKSDQWAGVPHHYRFVFSIDRLDEAVERLDQFWNQIERPSAL